MFIGFFEELRAEGIPVSLREFLDFLGMLRADLHGHRVDVLYNLARTSLVKHVKHYDRFDLVFGRRFRDLAATSARVENEIPDAWLEQLSALYLDEETLRQLKEADSLQSILDEFKKRLEEQKERHAGGSKWIGTGGTSRFGHGGFNPQGVRVGGKGQHRRAVKVWEKRQFRDLDQKRELGTRNFKMAMRTLRHFTREGREEEFDLNRTIQATARNAGLLETKFSPVRKNRVRVMILFDVGGSMDPYVRLCEELFSAARAEVEHLEWLYFHNCPYEHLWRRNSLSKQDLVSTEEVLRSYGRHYRLIFVGDAAMSPYEIMQPGGSVDHWNERPGSYWLGQLLGHFDRAIWLNPNRESDWPYTTSTRMIQDLMGDRMFGLTLGGLKAGLKELMRS